MTIFGWIVIGCLTLFVGCLLNNLLKEVLMNKKLNRFKVKNKMVVIPRPRIFYLKKTYQIVLATMLVFVVAISGVFSSEVRLENQKIMTQAQIVGSKRKLLSLIGSNSDFPKLDPFFSDTALQSSGSVGESGSRDFIDTNVQVAGVAEADIIKTDGNFIYYASRYHQTINVVYVNNKYEAEVLATINLGKVYTDNIYLTPDYVVVIGYKYNADPFQGSTEDFFIGWYYQVPTGTVVVIDRQTSEIVYEMETDSMFYEHRMIDDVLYLVSNKRVSAEDDDLRPMFKETKNKRTTTSYLSFSDIYYYDDILTSNMIVMTTIDVSDFTYQSQAFLGYVSQIYANKDHIYTVSNHYHFNYDVNNYSYKAQVLKFKINKDNKGKLTYQGGQVLEGQIQGSYWMDEHEGYFRVVTSSNWPAKNRFYVLKENDSEDILDIISLIDENLGLPGETVKSVRFNKEYAQVVTFKQTDPLYTIDISDPLKPYIKENPIEEEGFNTYMHIWNEDHFIIGFGFDADSSGRVTGLKMSAYDTRKQEPLDTYSFAEVSSEGFRYSYSEAVYNPRALLVDATRGIIGFPIAKFKYDTNGNGYHESSFVIFHIDFAQEKVISEPIFINHERTNYYTTVDRAIYIENIDNNVVTDRYIYTFSYHQIIVYHLETHTVIQTTQLNDPRNA